MGVCVYPGSFDPVTNGHLDIIQRASRSFDKIIVAVLNNPNKKPLFTVEERMDLLKKVTDNIENIEIDSFSGLLIDFMAQKNTHIIIKGLRQATDFEYEFQMSLMNKKLSDKIETLFMMANSKYSYLSSSIVKEVALFDGCIKGLVPEIVEQAIHSKLKSQ